jgi:hopanoid biosynthesis associated protein HpnK
MKRLIVSADDFGLSESVNEAVEIAHREGLLSTASLMVAGPAAADAVRRAVKLPKLRVGLHLVLVEGHSILPRDDIPALVDHRGWFPSNQVALGFRYFFHPVIRAQLAEEIRAQFLAFRETGLELDHLNAHKHMHLHPTVAQLALSIGREFGCKAVRLPRQAISHGIGGNMLNAWTAVLKRQATTAGMVTNDYVLGLSQSGHFDEKAFVEGLQALPPGITEAYFHPATLSDETLRRTMPDYDHAGELAALLSLLARDEIMRQGIELTTYSALA